MTGSTDGPAGSGPVVLYDGVCGLCTRSIQVILAHDRHARFRFAALGGAFATRALARHGYGPGRAAAPDALALVEGTGTANTGRMVFAASIPGRCAAPPAAAMRIFSPRGSACSAY